MANIYYPRMIDKVLERKLRSSGAILITGPMWCGKTKSAEHICASSIYLNPEDENDTSNLLAVESPDLALAGKTPRLIDEWQVVPSIWGKVKKAVDDRQELGQFILTGSATPRKPTAAEKNNTRHPGTGRINPVRMRPMSLFESKDSNGAISLQKLFDHDVSTAFVSLSPVKKEDVVFFLCRGGWPGFLLIKEKKDQLMVPKDYLSSYIGDNSNNEFIDRMRINKGRLRNILRSLARNTATSVAINTIREDIRANDYSTISEKTVVRYLSILDDLFLTENVKAWNPNLRSKDAIRQSDTRYFTDPSIGVAALGLSPNQLLQDPKTLGFFFENMAIRDLRCYLDSLGGSLAHYHDESGLEADAVLQLEDGRYALCEVKMTAPEHIEEGAKNLLTLANKIDDNKMSKPSFLMVITAGDSCYCRKDGVWIVPLGMLKD